MFTAPGTLTVASTHPSKGTITRTGPGQMEVSMTHQLLSVYDVDCSYGTGRVVHVLGLPADYRRVKHRRCQCKQQHNILQWISRLVSASNRLLVAKAPENAHSCWWQNLYWADMMCKYDIMCKYLKSDLLTESCEAQLGANICPNVGTVIMCKQQNCT